MKLILPEEIQVQRFNLGDYQKQMSQAATSGDMKQIADVFSGFVDSVQKQFDEILNNTVEKTELGMSGVFKTNDATPKTVTVTEGIITRGL